MVFDELARALGWVSVSENKFFETLDGVLSIPAIRSSVTIEKVHFFTKSALLVKKVHFSYTRLGNFHLK